MEQETKRCPYCGEEILAVAKKCKHCGEWLTEEKKDEVKKQNPCPVCGELIDEGTTKCPHCNESIISEVMQESIDDEVSDSDSQARSFFDYFFVEPFVRQYAKFNGRINRKHFWIAMLIWWSVTIMLLIVIGNMVIHNTSGIICDLFFFLFFVWLIGSIIPIWATTLRRMRDGSIDIGFWGWWFYIIPSPFLLWWLTRPSEDVRLDDLVPDEEPKVLFKKTDTITICTILIIFVGSLLSSVLGNKQNYSEESSIKSSIVDERTQKDIKNAYLDILTKCAAEGDDDFYTVTYFLYDITGDGIPELWIRSGTCEMDCKLSVYTYYNGLSVIEEGEEGSGGHSAFYKGKDYIIQLYGHMGFAGWTKITYKDRKLLYENIFEENLDEEGKDSYTEPSEQPVEEYSSDDTSHIILLFK